MSIQELFQCGYVHLMEETDFMVRLRFSKPMLRILAADLPLDLAPENRPFLHMLTAPSVKSLLRGATGKVILKDLFKTCRNYHGDTEEVVQLLSFLNACAAYVLLTPASRPELKSLADLRPAAQVIGDVAALVEAAEVLKMEAKMVDEASVEQRKAYEAAAKLVETLRARLDMGRTKERENELSDARLRLKDASSAYVARRHEAFLRLSARELCVRGEPTGHLHRHAALTEARTTGVDAWVCFGVKVYTMQCKGQETGAGAGQPGGDGSFEPKDVVVAMKMFVRWLQAQGDGEDRHVAALELLTTKRMTDASKASAVAGARPVVVVARDALLTSLGLVFGGIAARCHETEEKKAAEKKA